MKQQISSTKGPKALGPYSAGIATEGLVFLSGQLGVNTEGNLVSEDVVERNLAEWCLRRKYLPIGKAVFSRRNYSNYLFQDRKSVV